MEKSWPSFFVRIRILASWLCGAKDDADESNSLLTASHSILTEWLSARMHDSRPNAGHSSLHLKKRSAVASQPWQSPLTGNRIRDPQCAFREHVQ